MGPLISIITVSFNSEKTIERTLKSVAAQTYKNIEHIVIDGASTDGTVALISQHLGAIAYFRSEPDAGLYDAINKGWVRKWRKVGYKDKKNPDLWERLLKVHDRHRVTFHWVRGHNGDPRNERVDVLAVNAYRQGRLLVDAAYESTAR